MDSDAEQDWDALDEDSDSAVEVGAHGAGEGSDSDSDADMEEQPQARAANAPFRLPYLPAHHLAPDPQVHPIMRLLAGHAHADRHAAYTNEALVAHLIRTRTLQSPSIIAAMKACPRDAFVPEQQRDADAFLDAPLSLARLGFNMSAPHMHATCLEALQLQPGHRVLDVGSGSGVLTACMAFIVGKTGASVGFDTKEAAASFADVHVKRLEQSSLLYAETACSCTFEHHNVFIPASRHQGQYDRVHVGASCPRDKLNALVALLKPTGGILVSPVAPSDLQAITKGPHGEVSMRTLSQVRYSDLEVPTDVAVVMAVLQEDRKERIDVPVPLSTFSDDVATIHGDVIASSSSMGSEQSAFSLSSAMAMGTPHGAPGRHMSESSESPLSTARSWPKRFTKLLRACSSSSVGAPKDKFEEMMAADASEPATPGSPGPKPELRVGELGVADCALVGAKWRIPVHRAVLRARSEHVRAMFGSGMRDADSPEVHVPEHFHQEAAAAFVKYLYEDELDGRMDAQSTVALLHVAHFFGAPHLVGLCDLQLSRELITASADDEGACESSSALLALADETGLAHLRAVALDFIVHNHEAVANTAAYSSLTKHQVDLVAAEACQMLRRMSTVLSAKNEEDQQRGGPSTLRRSSRW